MIPEKEEIINAQIMRHGKELQEKFSASTVAICGLGGLGSLVAISLARVGVGKLILIDFDKVDVTNLHRQQYKACQVGVYKTQALAENLYEIAPYIEIETHNVKIDKNNGVELLKSADVICEAFDNPNCKAMLCDLVFENMPEKYLVSASGMAGLGSGNDVKTRKITDKFYLCGDEVSDVATSMGLFSSRVMLCASHQAHKIVQILADQPKK